MVIKHKTENKLIKFGHFMQKSCKKITKVVQNIQKNTIIIQNPLVKIVQKCYYTFVKKIDRGACPHITNKEDL